MNVLNSVELFKKTYDRLLTDVAKKYNLNLIELKILMFLEKNELTVAKDITMAIQATKSHVSMAVCDLQERGFIKKTKDESDKKKSHLKITNKSFSVINEGKETQKKIKEIMLNGITKDEIETLSNIAKKMQENLENYSKD